VRVGQPGPFPGDSLSPLKPVPGVRVVEPQLTQRALRDGRDEIGLARDILINRHRLDAEFLAEAPHRELLRALTLDHGRRCLDDAFAEPVSKRSVRPRFSPSEVVMDQVDTAPDDRWLAAVRALPALTTPAFVFDLERVRESATALLKLGCDRLMYSTKTCPQIPVLRELCDLGFDFDAATIGEIRLLIALGVEPAQILATHPGMPAVALTEAYQRGVRAFTFDSAEQMARLSRYAPAADWFLRIVPPRTGGLYDYRHRFGADNAETSYLFELAARNGYPVAGVSFHIGTQNGDRRCWELALSAAAAALARYTDRLPALRVLNIGSGFPARYAGEAPQLSLDDFADLLGEIRGQLPAHVQIWAEPGRILVADCAVLLTAITGVQTRAGRSWIQVDTSAYNGPVEILHSGRRMRYPIRPFTGHPQSGGRRYTIAGPTLDPEDLLAEDLVLPAGLAEADILVIGAVGAYTTQFLCDYHSLDRPAIIWVDTACRGMPRDGHTALVGQDHWERTVP
jgi:ornithine decarboxylase